MTSAVVGTRPFAGKYAVITGSTQGLGEATARLFAERGAAGLVICGRNAERGNAIASDLSAGGCDTHFVQAELGEMAGCRAVIAKADDKKGTRKGCKAVPGQMRVCNAAYGNNGWLGLAQIWLDGNGHIVQGVAKMNDSYSSVWTDPAEKNHVFCQEVGHVLGLDHTSVDGSSQQSCKL